MRFKSVKITHFRGYHATTVIPYGRSHERYFWPHRLLEEIGAVIEKVRMAELEVSGEPAQTQAFAQAVAERELLVPV